jgi:hypothetical protein
MQPAAQYSRRRFTGRHFFAGGQEGLWDYWVEILMDLQILKAVLLSITKKTLADNLVNPWGESCPRRVAGFVQEYRTLLYRPESAAGRFWCRE